MCYKENETNLKQLRGMKGTILERAARQGFFKEAAIMSATSNSSSGLLVVTTLFS